MAVNRNVPSFGQGGEGCSDSHTVAERSLAPTDSLEIRGLEEHTAKQGRRPPVHTVWPGADQSCSLGSAVLPHLRDWTPVSRGLSSLWRAMIVGAGGESDSDCFY